MFTIYHKHFLFPIFYKLNFISIGEFLLNLYFLNFQNQIE